LNSKGLHQELSGATDFDLVDGALRQFFTNAKLRAVSVRVFTPIPSLIAFADMMRPDTGLIRSCWSCGSSSSAMTTVEEEARPAVRPLQADVMPEVLHASPAHMRLRPETVQHQSHPVDPRHLLAPPLPLS
jgi:hypothetical protein